MGEEDNIEVLLESAEKFAIIRPILKPSVLEATARISRPHCAQLLQQCIDSFYPDLYKETRKLNKDDAKSENSDDVPEWMMDLESNSNAAQKMILDAPTTTVVQTYEGNTQILESDVVQIESG